MRMLWSLVARLERPWLQSLWCGTIFSPVSQFWKVLCGCDCFDCSDCCGHGHGWAVFCRHDGTEFWLRLLLLSWALVTLLKLKTERAGLQPAAVARCCLHWLGAMSTLPKLIKLSYSAPAKTKGQYVMDSTVVVSLATWAPRFCFRYYRGLNDYLYYLGAPYYSCSMTYPKPLF